jgi:hypothetical protein
MAARVEAAREETEEPAPSRAPAAQSGGRREIELAQFQAEFPGLVSISRVQQVEAGEEG